MQTAYREWLSKGPTRRWLVVVGGILINMAMGVLYAWSVFRSPMVTEFKWDPLTATWPFILATFVFAVLMIPAGRWNDRYGPMPVGVAGGLLMGIAFIATSWAPKGLANAHAAFTWIMLTYGVLAGSAMGLGYAVPVASGVKWFPDKRGLVVGLCVMGFGGSALVFGPLANTMIAASNVWNTFFQLGFVFLIMTVVGSLLLTTPPAGWKPAGWSPAAGRATVAGREEKRDFSPGELLRIPQTYMLIIMYAFAAASGLMVISFAKNYLDSFQFNQIARSQGLGWINAIPVIGFNIFTGKTAELSAALVGWLSLWNALGRMLIGWLSDRIGRRNAMVLDQGTTFVIMLLTPLLTGSAWMILLMYLLIGLTYGGNLSVFPATNADWFGTKHVGVNYGIIFIGWGLAGVIGPVVGNFGVQALGGYRTGFVFAAILAVIAAFMSYSIKRPAVREEVERIPAHA